MRARQSGEPAGYTINTCSRSGHLFVTEQGIRKHQATLTVQIIRAIAQHVGIHMTPHQFRHFVTQQLPRRFKIFGMLLEVGRRAGPFPEYW